MKNYQNLDDMIYNSWDIEQNILKLVILGHFLPFYPPENPKNQVLNNEKICWRYHHIIHVYPNHNHMMYGSWDTEQERQNFLSFWIIFFSLSPSPLMILKIKILKKWKKCQEILSFHTYMCTINEDHMIYGSWNVRCHRHFCHFGPFFALSAPWQPGKSKF